MTNISQSPRRSRDGGPIAYFDYDPDKVTLFPTKEYDTPYSDTWYPPRWRVTAGDWSCETAATTPAVAAVKGQCIWAYKHPIKHLSKMSDMSVTLAGTGEHALPDPTIALDIQGAEGELHRQVDAGLVPAIESAALGRVLQQAMDAREPVRLGPRFWGMRRGQDGESGLMDAQRWIMAEPAGGSYRWLNIYLWYRDPKDCFGGIPHMKWKVAGPSAVRSHGRERPWMEYESGLGVLEWQQGLFGEDPEHVAGYYALETMELEQCLPWAWLAPVYRRTAGLTVH